MVYVAWTIDPLGTSERRRELWCANCPARGDKVVTGDKVARSRAI
jgi:hypothetical protein